MSAWKRTALEKLPEYRPDIEEAGSPMALWLELHPKFETVYETTPLNDDLIGRFYDYARWCLSTPGDGKYFSDVGTAAALAFYEHLPEHAVIRKDLPRWLTIAEFKRLCGVFAYHLSEEQFIAFEKEFLAASRKQPWRQNKAFRQPPG